MQAPILQTTDHPADYIDHAQAMLRFLSAAVGETSPQCHFEGRELEGLCYIISHIEDNLAMAHKLLS